MQEPLPDLFHLSRESLSGKIVAGVDEAGRGALAGPVIASAVILRADCQIENCCDSKQLNATQRLAAAEQIKAQAVAFALGRSEVTEIDQINILQASLLAMKRAIEGLKIIPHIALIDGLHLPQTQRCAMQAIVAGDQKVRSISAASILAKVTRDELMCQLHQQYPLYQFDQHKGYPTSQHLDALHRHGVCQAHRRSYRPVRQQLMASKRSA